jgi:hypothetical protein
MTRRARSQAAPRQESSDTIGALIPLQVNFLVCGLIGSSHTAQCYNCHTTATPLWREGKTVEVRIPGTST